MTSLYQCLQFWRYHETTVATDLEMGKSIYFELTTLFTNCI